MDKYRSLRFGLMVALAVVSFNLTGCTPDAAHRNIPAPAVKTVTAPEYGLTLDEKATPQQVAFVFLRSIADDVHAAQSHDADKKDKQRAAMERTHALLAYSIIEQRLLQTENLARKQKVDSLGPDRNEKLWDFARELAPIVAYYVNSFDTNVETAAAKMRLNVVAGSNLVHIYYEAVHDPVASDPDQRDAVIIDIELSQEHADGKTYWRVAKVGFQGRPGSTRPLATRPTSRPTSIPTSR